MDVLTIPPIPPTEPLMAIAAPDLPALTSGVATDRRWQRAALTVGRNLALLPFRLVRRLVEDVASVLTHACMALWNGGLTLAAFAGLGLLVAVESAMENLFMGEVLQSLLPVLSEYLPDVNPLAALLAGYVPAVDEVRASSVVALVVALAGVMMAAAFFHGLRGVLMARGRKTEPVQEALLLGPMTEEASPAAPRPVSPMLVVALVAGATVTLGLFGAEWYLFGLVFQERWIGLAGAGLLLLARLAFGFVGNPMLHVMLPRGRQAIEHVEMTVSGLWRLVPNVVSETAERLRALGVE